VNPPPPPTAVPRLRLRLTAAAESIVKAGHPWVYSDKVREQNRPGRAGELAVLYDRQDRFLGLGLFDPDSPLRVRMLHTGKPVTVDAAWWRARLLAAVARRRDAFGPETDGFRWVNGESDGWPGLILDRYGDTLVLKLYSPAWLGALGAGEGALTGLKLIELIQEVLQPKRLVLRLSRNLQSAAAVAGWQDGQNLIGTDSAGSVIFQEYGLRFESDVVRGQKTGFFLDQRENRRRIGALSAGADVLNVFSFSGGFSLHAARGGARSVTDLDVSPHALQSARRNFALNRELPAVAATRHEQVQADAFEWVARGPVAEFDVVILDPPSLAKRETERAGAIQAYHRLVASGLERVRPGGLLLAASCSAHVSAGEFYYAVRQALRESGRPFQELETAGHAVDHRATFPEGEYLKAIYARLGRQ
jgi:23S rRNA (cytosine1962-C5)-methyltransferase